MPQIRQGSTAPDFSAQTLTGETIRLSDLRGRKVWLCFYRYSRCPLCLHHLHDINVIHERLRENNVQVVTIFESTPEKFPNVRAAPGIRVISDPQKNLYRLYGTERGVFSIFRPQVIWALVRAAMSGFFQRGVDGDLGQRPAHFLIREDGVVHTAYYGSDIADQIPAWVVERFANEESVDEWRSRTQSMRV